MRRVGELLLIPLRGLVRAGLGWAIVTALLVIVTVAFWPAFRNASDLSQAFLNQLPHGFVEALGLEDLDTPAGFLRGNLYELLVPLLVGAAAIVMANGQTAGEEDAGRLELYLAQPVSRPATFVGRVVGVAIWLAVIGLIVLAAQVASDAVFGLDIAPSRLVTTVALCTLLAGLHAGLAFAIAGWWPRPGLVLGVGLAVLFAGYLVAALFPLNETLAPWRHVSPWDWAVGGDPLAKPTEAWRYLALAGPAVGLAILGLVGFARRDVRTA